MRSIAKRFFRILFALLFTFSCISLGSCAERTDLFRYTVDESGSAVIIGYKGYDRSLTIPSDIDGIPVAAVAETAFYANSILRKISISAGIGRIEKDAFAYCPNLNEVTFEDGGCTFIGEAAFEGCSMLKELRLPDTLTEIDDFAFRGCIRLGKVEMPSSLTRIGYQAFGDCESLVFSAENSQTALDYAENNNIDLSFGESSASLWLKIGGGTAALLVFLFAVFCFMGKGKRKKQKTK